MIQPQPERPPRVGIVVFPGTSMSGASAQSPAAKTSGRLVRKNPSTRTPRPEVDASTVIASATRPTTCAMPVASAARGPGSEGRTTVRAGSNPRFELLSEGRHHLGAPVAGRGRERLQVGAGPRLEIDQRHGMAAIGEHMGDAAAHQALDHGLGHAARTDEGDA